jgi:hypothetical protein
MERLPTWKQIFLDISNLKPEARWESQKKKIAMMSEENAEVSDEEDSALGFMYLWMNCHST